MRHAVLNCGHSARLAAIMAHGLRRKHLITNFLAGRLLLFAGFASFEAVRNNTGKVLLGQCSEITERRHPKSEQFSRPNLAIGRPNRPKVDHQRPTSARRWSKDGPMWANECRGWGNVGRRLWPAPGDYSNMFPRVLLQHCLDQVRDISPAAHFGVGYSSGIFGACSRHPWVCVNKFQDRAPGNSRAL